VRLIGARSAGGAAGGRAGSWLLHAYPRWWRDRYEEELTAVLDARRLDLRARLDLLRGAFDAHLRGPDPEKAPRLGTAAALVAGGAWTIAGIASTGGPTPPDWPGYLVATLPVALTGVVAVGVASLGVARLAWTSSGSSVEVAVVGTVVGNLAWAIALVVAVLGGPYGAITALAQSMAAIAMAGLGLALLRADVHPIGEAVVVAGALLLIPTPAAWVVVGGLWTVIGLWRYVETRWSERLA
jgi:hypothetical protein